MERTEKVILTNMCMVYDGNRVLVQHRINPNWPGITFPGGHVERGESLTDAVIRSVREETGLTVLSPQLCGVKDWINSDGSRYMVLCYKTDQYQGELASSDEGDVFWTALETMKELPLAKDMDQMLEIFLNPSVSEYFFYRENRTWIGKLK